MALRPKFKLIYRVPFERIKHCAGIVFTDFSPIIKKKKIQAVTLFFFSKLNGTCSYKDPSSKFNLKSSKALQIFFQVYRFSGSKTMGQNCV